MKFVSPGNRATIPRSMGAVATALCGALVIAAACSSSGPSKPTKAADPLATAIATELNSYTTDDYIRAIIVQVDGRTRFEHYYNSSADQSRSSFSVTKERDVDLGRHRHR